MQEENKQEMQTDAATQPEAEPVAQNPDVAPDAQPESDEKNATFESLRSRILTDIEESESTEEKPEKRGRKSPVRAIILACVIVFVSIGLASAILMTAAEIMGVGGSENIVQIEIPKGSSTQKIAEILKEKKIIRSTYLFRFVAKNEESHFNYGVFTLSDSMSYGQIFQALEEASPITDVVNFTVIEGDTLQTIAKKLEKKQLCTAVGFMNVVNDASFGYSFEDEISDDPLIFYRAEGYLFPDTYQLHKGMSAEDIVQVFYGNFSSKFTDEMRERMVELHMTLSDTITLASIIQAEAPTRESMKKVSGVFHNRLNHPSEFPRLESDPTKKYVKNVIRPNEEKRNRSMETAYDTYQGTGLTPGPICNPGLDAIIAALYPDTEGDYFYFCANTRTKQIYLARTLAEHNANLHKAGLS